MASIISEQGGTLSVLQASLQGLMILAGDVQPVRENVEREIERVYATGLGGSTNPDWMRGFEEASMRRGDLLRLTLSDLKEDGIHVTPHKTLNSTGMLCVLT